MASRDIYERLRAPGPTPDDELCTCPAGTPVILVSTFGFNPIKCLNCNGEVVPERLGLSSDLVEDVYRWLQTHGAIDRLELESGHYEQWARVQLLDPSSPPNFEGRQVAGQLNELNRCYFHLFQPVSDDDWVPLATCPICDEPLTQYDQGRFPWLVCERDSVVMQGGGSLD